MSQNGAPPTARQGRGNGAHANRFRFRYQPHSTPLLACISRMVRVGARGSITHRPGSAIRAAARCLSVLHGCCWCCCRCAVCRRRGRRNCFMIKPKPDVSHTRLLGRTVVNLISISQAIISPRPASQLGGLRQRHLVCDAFALAVVGLTGECHFFVSIKRTTRTMAVVGGGWSASAACVACCYACPSVAHVLSTASVKWPTGSDNALSQRWDRYVPTASTDVKCTP